MIDLETSLDLSDGDRLIRRLFEVAIDRLSERGISMHYAAPVIDWMLKQSEWTKSLNPQKTLHGYWHHAVASVIEKLMLDGHLRPGDTLSVDISENPSSGLRFDVSPGTESKRPL